MPSIGLGLSLSSLGLLGGAGVPSWVVNPANAPDLMLDFTQNLSWVKATKAVGTAASYLADARTGVKYIDNSAGLWQQFASTVLAQTDLGASFEPGVTNSALYCRDMTQATAWTASNITPVKNATGIDSTANAATTLTAGALNGTILQTLSLSGSSYSVFLKRLAGTGAVSITKDGGTTWTDITAQINASSFTRVKLENVSITSVGIKIAASGDAVIADFNQAENLNRVTSPILTTTVAVSRSADSTTANAAIIALLAGNFTLYAELSGDPESLVAPAQKGVFQFNPSNDSPAFFADAAYFKGSPNLISSNGVARTFGRKIVVSKSASGRTVVQNGGYEVSDTTVPAAPTSIYIGSWDATDYLIGSRLKRLAFWASQISPSQRAAVTNLPFNYTPYATAHALQGIYGQGINAGAVLTYEYTQPWTVASSLVMAGMPAANSMIVTNVDNSPYPGYEFFIDGSGFARVRVINSIVSAFIDVYAPTNLGDGAHHVVAATYDGTGLAAGIKIYIDGVSQTLTVASNNLGGASIIGGGNTYSVMQQLNFPQYMFNGAMFYVAQSNLVRSGAYIAALSATVVPTVDANTVLSYSFSEGSGLTTADASSNGFTGTLSSAAMWL